jgi:hypothetical protein
MKIFPAAVLSTVVVCLAPLMAASAQEAPAKWGPGCDKALLDGEFSLAKAPEIACAKEKKAFIDKIIGEVKGDPNRMQTEPFPSPVDTAEFTAFFLRAFADPGEDIERYSGSITILMGRTLHSRDMLKDARLDWDMWRAWLLFENTGHMTDYWIWIQKGTGTGPKLHLFCAREVLWAYLYLNAAEIFKDPRRRAWWLTRLTEDLEAPGGRPWRRWFLLLLLAKEDPTREALRNTKLKPVYSKYMTEMELRQPRPLDPFLIVTGENPQIPAFGEAVTQMALNSKLSLTVLGIDPATQPATRVDTVSLGSPKYAGDEAKIIYQESWSAPPGKRGAYGELPLGYEWDAPFYSPTEWFLSVNLPEDRTDGVFFFVYNQRLYVWPKAKMDAGVIQMLRTANLIDAAAAAAFEKRGLVPLKETLVK